MELLENPEVRYGPLPSIEAARRLLEPRLDLQVYQGAMDYLNLHLARIQECYAVITEKKGFWHRYKAKAAFTNTTRALRMIMVFHRDNMFVLNEMAKKIKTEMDGVEELRPHYLYLLSLLKILGSREAEA